MSERITQGERFNGRLREECLARCAFDSFVQAHTRIGMWRSDYNSVRQHCALGQLTSDQFPKMHQSKTAEAASLQMACPA
ncbi:integrase core domain-containing protein [Burkholderia ubonensis]|uniref:Integrase catalytic domain-containing protein n=1 Tax=Burkholderia ubonensis subsp. mesacidophila TaxID=265293 RepID=A0A2A4EW50_9BURK|nr:integrase core domain-containing protein [Burkholderia ubonensis]PCE24618.1 hypothetical protein BZL54_32930 [Burkholderia ubonensis subsp. mesacidophila]